MPPATLDESSDDDATPLVADDLVADDLEIPHDRSTDSSVITCVRIDPREILSEEPVRSRPPAAPKAPPQPQKLPSILEMMQRSSAGSSQQLAKPAPHKPRNGAPLPRLPR